MKYLLSHSQCNTQQAERTNERTAASKHWDEVNICLKTRTLNVNTISCHFPCVMPALLFAISNILCSLGFHSSDRHRRYIRVPSFFSFRSLCKSYSKNIFFRLMGKSLFYGSLFFCILPTFLLGKKKFSYSHKSNSSRQLWKPRNSCCSHSHFYGFIEDHCVVIISFGFDVRTQVITPSTHRAKPLLTFCLLLLLEISSTVRKQHSSV